MHDDDYYDAVEVIGKLSEPETGTTRNEALYATMGIVQENMSVITKTLRELAKQGETVIKYPKGETLSVIADICKSYDKRKINMRMALVKILATLKAEPRMDEIMNMSEEELKK